MIRWSALVILIVSVRSVEAASLPKEMLGAWASDPSACGAQASELGMTIGPQDVLFYEHGFDVKRLTKLKDGSLKASGFSFADDGRTKDTLTLKPLSMDTIKVRGQIYHRCKNEDQNGGTQ